MKKRTAWIEKIGQKIPDPVIIFICLYILVMLVTAFLGGRTFETATPDGAITYTFKNMFQAENFRWIFKNALLSNWLAYGNGILGSILIVIFGIGVAEESGLLSALIRRAGTAISVRFLPYVLVFLGIMSNVATDAGYIVLVPLAGLLYAGIGKNPLIGMAAAFAGVSAGFSANLIPATAVDVIIGTNAQNFAQSQNIPFISYTGHNIHPMTMHYYFMVTSTVVLVLLGGFITNRWIGPKLEKTTYQIPADENIRDFKITDEERKAMRWALVGLLIGAAAVLLLAFGPLRPYVDETGKKVTPFLDQIILIITFLFFAPGLFYGFAIGKFNSAGEVVRAVSKQLGATGYVLVLTFFSYNFLALLTYTNIGTYITFIGAKFLQTAGLSHFPILLMLGFILVTAVINLFVGGLTSKWMLLGPIFVPMLYHVNPEMTPDVVSAAYRVADSCTNTITPLMTYAGVILMYMRRYKSDFSVSDLIGMMFPYSAIFLVVWSLLLIIFIWLKIPLGF